MQWNASVTLIKETTEYNNDVDEIKREITISNVPAKIKSVGGTEFYAARSAGIQTDLLIELMTANYNDAQYIIDERTNIKYELVRSYTTRNGERIKLTVSVFPIKKGGRA